MRTTLVRPLYKEGGRAADRDEEAVNAEAKGGKRKLEDDKMTVFWDIGRCGLVEVDRRFRSVYCLLHQGDESRVHGTLSQKAVIFIAATVRI
jgi:hypothetical protein